VSRRLPLLLSMAALVLLAVVVAHGSSSIPQGQGLVLRPHRPAPITNAGGAAATRYLANQPATAVTVGVLILLFFAALLLASAAAVVTLLSLRRRSRRRHTAVPDAAADDDESSAVATGQALLRGARGALAELRRRPGEDPGDTVQRAWLSLEEAAAESGAARRPEQTPTEFTTALLAAHRVDDTALATLRARYQRARFGRPGTVTAADATAAVDALTRIAADLAAALENTAEPELEVR
jgi:hypothetical protein